MAPDSDLDSDVIKEEDTYRWTETLTHPQEGGTYDLTDANDVRLYVDHLRSGSLVVNSPVEIVDAANGEIAYEFSRAETARAGTHRGELVVDESTDTEDNYTTVPGDGYIKFPFIENLPRDADLEPATADADATVATLTATDWVDSPDGRFGSVTTDNADITSATIGDVDPEQVVAGWSLSMRGPMGVQNAGNALQLQEPLTPLSMILNVNDGSAAYTIFADQTQDKLYRTTAKGGALTEVGTTSATPQAAVATFRDTWLVIVGSGSEPHTAYLYGSASDIGTTSNALATQTDVWAPRSFDIEGFWDASKSGDDREGIMWAEYGNGASTWNVYKAQGGGSITSVLSDSNIGHFHTLDHDPWNQGTFYVTSGDSAGDSHVWKSTDFGDTWTQIVNGNQKFKTLRFAFGPDYVYTGTDANINGSPRFYRFQRSDPEGTIEELFDYGNTPWGDYSDDPRLLPYGLCYVENPRGILIGNLEKVGNVSKCPVFFWDIRASKLRRVYEIPTQGVANQGVWWLSPHRDQNTGSIYAGVHNQETWHNEFASRDWDRRAAYELDTPSVLQ